VDVKANARIVRDELTDREKAEYAGLSRLAERCEPELEQKIFDGIRCLGDRFIVRARIESHRVKSAESIARKARQLGWAVSETFSKAQDFIGFRVVCNNLQEGDPRPVESW
jgi:hypothetical protein